MIKLLNFDWFPAVYFNCLAPEDRELEFVDTDKYPAELGVTLELCAGIVDKDKPLVDIACEEVLEECGYHIKLSDLELVNSYRYIYYDLLCNQRSYYLKLHSQLIVLKMFKFCLVCLGQESVCRGPNKLFTIVKSMMT